MPLSFRFHQPTLHADVAVKQDIKQDDPYNVLVSYISIFILENY